MGRTEKQQLIEEVKTVLRERRLKAGEALPLVKRLKRAQLFDYACRVLALAREQPTPDDGLRLKLAQEHAICTYKNQDQPVFDRLDAALGILKQAADVDSTSDQETLGIAGSIYKQKWWADGQKQHLETSFRYYFRGHQHGVITPDRGYTGINAAFVLDLLAEIESETDPEGAGVGFALTRRDLARTIRQEIAAGLEGLTGTPIDYWFAVTIGEAYFGLREYERAIDWFRRAKGLDSDGWQREATARQLARLASIQDRTRQAARRQTRESARATAATTWDAMARVGIADPLARTGSELPAALHEPLLEADLPADRMGPYDVVREFLDLPEDVIRDAFLGKVGLALSGGGFRASLFHIGVLARLAEQDILRRVEVLSCVSGGSILGAYYYLELRRLLETKTDEEITREDYIELVGRVASGFLAGVQTNIRTRAIASFPANLRMVFSRRYSRTHRLGELYETHLFSRIEDGQGGDPRYLNDLEIRPKGAPPDFHPRWHNWQRRAKVPSLVLNATALNTGHLWQFTASYMGEPAASINTRVDGNYRLRRMYYSEAPEGYTRMRLGHAVAASSCVPGLFEPLQFAELYPGVTVSLVDGGVHDNQGLAGVFEQGCDNLIVSDASGQMDQDDSPAPGFLPVLSRSNSVLQARLRDIQLRDLDTRGRSSMVRSTVVHLKQELAVMPRDWRGCDDPKEHEEARGQSAFTSYGIRRNVQRMLAGIRTDLDSFCDAEAFALMVSGYRLMDRQLETGSAGWSSLERSTTTWTFQQIEPAMLQAAPGDRLTRILQTASAVPFKVWKLLPPLKYASIAAAVGLMALLAFVHVQFGPRTLGEVEQLLPEFLRVRVGDVIFSLVTLLIVLLVGGIAARIVQMRNFGSRVLFGAAVGLLGWIIAFVHLRLFDRAYLAYGRRDRFVR